MAYFRVHYSAGMCGTDCSEVVEATTSDEAVDAYVDTAWDWYYSFNQKRLKSMMN